MCKHYGVLKCFKVIFFYCVRKGIFYHNVPQGAGSQTDFRGMVIYGIMNLTSYPEN